ncbi:MAG TPA: hypothetical protein VMZ91_01890 [Candidatus Paceibacterota bacterium]|nr:hypothetical protein [Candidatus Paceibacterota bacterium]
MKIFVIKYNFYPDYIGGKYSGKKPEERIEYFDKFGNFVNRYEKITKDDFYKNEPKCYIAELKEINMKKLEEKIT